MPFRQFNPLIKPITQFDPKYMRNAPKSRISNSINAKIVRQSTSILAIQIKIVLNFTV